MSPTEAFVQLLDVLVRAWCAHEDVPNDPLRLDATTVRLLPADPDDFAPVALSAEVYGAG